MAVKLGGGGGVSVPIGSTVALLDTANTVTRGGETFLKGGQLSNSSTYPNAPVRNFMGNGTLATQTYGGAISPWGGYSPVNINTQGVIVNDTDTTNLWRWVCTSDGYIHRLTNRGQTWNKRRKLNDGTVFSASAYASYMQVFFNNDQQSDLTHANTANSKQNMIMVMCRYDGNQTKVAYLSPDLDTHYGTFTISFDGPYAGNENRAYIGCMIQNNTYFLVATGNTSNIYFWQYAHPSGTSGTLSSSDYGYLHYTNNFNSWWQQAPELVPWYAYSQITTGNFPTNHVGIKCSVSGTPRIHYFSIAAALASGGNYVYSSVNHSALDGGVAATYNSPAKASDSSSALFYHRNSQVAPYSVYNSNLQTGYTWPSAYSSSGYSGYTQESSSKIWIGVGGENKIIRLHPTTYDSQTTISTSSQQAPKQLAWYNDLVFNFAADSKIYRYNSTNNAYVGVTDATSYISAGNGAGIAIDSANGDLYLLDKSNSKIHKYNSSLVYQSFVTLSDTPHSAKTLAALAINTTNDVFFVTENTNNQILMYGFDGTYKEAFVANNASVDADYHDSNIVTMNNTTQTSTKTSTHDAVGSPTDGSGAIFSSYTRVD
tara:strand:+ start:827 stop:2623 length:1797 start_codon:yes stop_codon:yes gene_type:complete